jgi:hypothetical protein
VSDELWSLIEPLLPEPGPKLVEGRPRCRTATALCGILFVLHTGIHRPETQRVLFEVVADVRAAETAAHDVRLALAPVEEPEDLGGELGLVRARLCIGRLRLRSALTSSSGFSSGECGGRKCSSRRSG